MASDKSQEVIDFLESHTHQSVDEFVRSNGWNEDPGLVKRVLNGNATDDDIEYLNSKLGSLSHKRDSRSAEEYGAELIRGWVIEDLIADKLRSAGISVSLSGKDKNREFLEETTADADLVATVNGVKTHIEVVTDYGGFWQRTGNADLRDNKYNEIQNHTNTLVLGIDFDNNSVFVVNPEETKGEYMQSHPYWNKPAYRFDVSDIEFVPLSEVGSKMKTAL